MAVILERRRPGAEVVLVCQGGPAGRVTLPVAWTDRVPAAMAHRLAVEGLAALAQLASALEHPPSCDGWWVMILYGDDIQERSSVR